MEIYLIAQRDKNLDVQVRELFSDHIHLTNLRQSARILGVPVIPFNFFIAGWFNHAYQDEVINTERYRLGWEKRLYDTMDTVRFTEGEEGGGPAIWLPRPDGSDPEPEREARGAPQGAPAAAPDPDAPPAAQPLADPGHVPSAPDPAQ